MLSPKFMFLRLTHTGLMQDGRPNLSSVLIKDMDSGYEYQSRRSPQYVPVGSYIDVPLTSKSLYSYQYGDIYKFVEEGVITADTFMQFKDLNDYGGLAGTGINLALVINNIQRIGNILKLVVLQADSAGYIVGEQITISGLVGAYLSLNGTYTINTVSKGTNLAGPSPAHYLIQTTSVGGNIAAANQAGLVLLPDGKTRVQIRGSGDAGGLGAESSIYVGGQANIIGGIDPTYIQFTPIADSDAPDGSLYINSSGSVVFKDVSGEVVGFGVIVDLADPTPTDDRDHGFPLGKRWINTTTNTQFVSVDDTPGFAIWANTTINPITTPTADRVPKAYGTGLLDPGWTAKAQTITVSSSGADFTSVKAACDSILDSSAIKPYAVLVYPGVYTEDPFTIPSFVSVFGAGSYIDVRLAAANNNAHFITSSPDAFIGSLGIQGPTGVGFSAIHHTSVSLAPFGISQCIFYSGYYCIYVNPVGYGLVNMCYTFIYDEGTAIENFIRVENQGSVISQLCDATIYTGSLSRALYVSGVNAQAIFDSCTINSAGTIGLYVDDGAQVRCNTSTFRSGDTAIWVGPSGASEFFGNSDIVRRGGYTTDIRVDSVTATVSYTGQLSKSKIVLVPGATFSGSITDPDPADFGQAVFGELYLGDSDNYVPLGTYSRDTISTGWATGGVVSRNAGGGLLVDVSAGHGYAFNGSDAIEVIWTPALAYALTDNSTNYIYVHHTGVISHSVSYPDYTDNIRLAIAYTQGGVIISLVDYKLPLPQLRNQLHTYHEDVIGPISNSGCAATIHTPPSLQLDVDGGTFFIVDYERTVTASSPITFTYWYRTAGGWLHTLAQASINVLKYDDGTGVLHNLTALKFKKELLYVTDTNEYHIVYGQAEYNSQIDAEAAGNPISPDFLQSRTLRVASIVVEQGAAAIASVTDQRPRLGQFASVAGAVTVHADLAGLGSDDHLQYLFANGTRALMGDLDLDSNDILNVGTLNGVTVESHNARHILGGADEIDGDKAGIDFSPTNYVPDNTDPLAPSVNHLTAHLKGIDNLSGDHDSRHILGGADEIDGDKVDIDIIPSYYTPDNTDPLAPNVDHLGAHLKGIDNQLNTINTLASDHDSRHILGGADEIDGDKVDIDITPSYYTPDNSDPLAPNVDHLGAHLKGIDNQLNTINLLAGDHNPRHITGGADIIDGDQLNITFSPSNYTRTTTVEAPTVNDLTAHLKGIDALLIFGKNYTSASSVGISASSSITYADKVTISTPAITGTLLVQWSIQISSNSNARPTKIRIQNTTDAVTLVSEMSEISQSNSIYTTRSGMFEFTAAGVAKTLALQFAANAAGQNTNVREANLILWRVS
jgi:hypothetical protein